MNCSSATDQSLIDPKLRQFTQITFWLLCVLFLLFCVYPLFKLVRERTALYILVSKVRKPPEDGSAIILFPDLLFLFSKILNNPLVIRLIAISQNARQNMTMFGLVNNRLHIIALAANRAYALLLPILYSHKITKKCILLQCLLLHLLSFILTPFYIFLSQYSWTYLTYLGVSSSFYVAIAIRLAWIKAHNRSGNASQSVDKNSRRITATCFAIQILAIVFTMNGVASNYDWYNELLLCHPIGQILSYPLQFFVSLYPISDELLLLVLCKDMRDLFKRIIGKVLAFVKKRNPPKTTPVQKMSNNVTKNDNRMPKNNTDRVINRRAMPPVEKITH